MTDQMNRIEARTSYRAIFRDGNYKPSAPLFLFKNTGNTEMFINNDKLFPGEVFGIDSSNFLAIAFLMGKKIRVEDVTEYQIRFGDTVVAQDPGLFGSVPRKTAVLITTEYYEV